MYTGTASMPSLPTHQEYVMDINKPALPLYLSGHSFSDEILQPFFTRLEAISGTMLTAIEKEAIIRNCSIKKLRRKQQFLHEGMECRQAAYNIRGASKMYMINDRGQESIIALSLEHDWMINLDSFFGHHKSLVSIEAVEDSMVINFTHDQLCFLLTRVHAFQQLFRQYQDATIAAYQHRLLIALSMTAEEKYHELLTSRQDLFQRFPLNTIAAYLGMSAETLSRIRKR